MDTSCAKQSESPSKLHTYWEEPDQTNTDNITNCYDRPKYVVDVLGRAVSKTYRRLPESINHRHVEAHAYRRTIERKAVAKQTKTNVTPGKDLLRSLSTGSNKYRQRH